MLKGIHILLTYKCTHECDHCFLYCSPKSEGVYKITQISRLLDQAKKTDTIDEIFFEGGEPSLFYPLMLEGVRQANSLGFSTGIVTNAYGINSFEDAELWLKPLAEAGLSKLHISNDLFHYPDVNSNPAHIAYSASKKLGIDSMEIAIEEPEICEAGYNSSGKGNPVTGGNVMFRGRAVEKLINDLPLRPVNEFNECPHEDLISPSRVHIDPYGFVQICQGISIGNIWKEDLSEIMYKYNPEKHPVCGHLVKGGPALLAQETGINPGNGYVDECHLCYETRRSIIDQYPDYLAPEQVYGFK